MRNRGKMNKFSFLLKENTFALQNTKMGFAKQMWIEKMTGRVCTICKAWKGWHAFYASKKSKDGHTTLCKECYRSRYIGQRVKPEYEETSHKTCTKCLESLPKSSFHTNNRQRNKCCARCKKCISSIMKQRYAERREKIQLGLLVSDLDF